jgi:peptidylprolyl isomerase
MTCRSLVARTVLPAILGLAAGCSGSAGDVLARGGETTLGVKDVQEIIDNLPAPTRTALQGDKAALERVVRSELVRRALVAEAKSGNLDSDPKVAEQLDRVRDEALMRLWLAKQAQVSDAYPSDEDLKLAYQANAAALTPPAQYRVAQIFVSAPNGIAPAQLAVAMRKAAEVGAKISGGDFAALAREYSEHGESASRGGDVGLLPANQILPEIVAAVRDLEVSATAGPIKTSQGLHYVKLLEKKVEPAPTFEQAREPLKAALRARRAQELEQAYLAALDAKLKVAIDEIALARLAQPAAGTVAAK